MVSKKHAARRNSPSAKTKSEISNNKGIGLAMIFAGLILLMVIGLAMLTNSPTPWGNFLWGLSRNRTLALAIAAVLIGSFIVDN